MCRWARSRGPRPAVWAVLAAAGVCGAVLGRFAVRVSDHYTPRGCGMHGVGTPLAAAAVFAAVVARFGVAWEVIPPLVAAAALVVLSSVDLRSYRLPDLIVLPAFGVSLMAVSVVSLITGRPVAVAAAAAAALGYGALMWAVRRVNRGGLGLGDVKLAPLLGLHLGWTAAAFHSGWTDIVGLIGQALVISSSVGLAMGASVAVLRRRGLDVLPDPAALGGGAAEGRDEAAEARRSLHPPVMATGFPFGPALAAGTLAAVLFSEALVG